MIETVQHEIKCEAYDGTASPAVSQPVQPGRRIYPPRCKNVTVRAAYGMHRLKEAALKSRLYGTGSLDLTSFFSSAFSSGFAGTQCTLRSWAGAAASSSSVSPFRVECDRASYPAIRRKDGNHQVVPLVNSTGYDAWQIILQQCTATRGIRRAFPYHSKPIGRAFHRSCNDIDLNDLGLPDLHYESTSRLFEAGFSNQQVAMVTGHKDWRMLRCYANLKPADPHKMQEATQPSVEQFLAVLLASWQSR